MDKTKLILVLTLYVVIVYFIVRNFIIGLLKQIKHLSWMKKYAEQEYGIVNDYVLSNDADGTPMYYPIVVVEINNEQHRIKSQHPFKDKPVIGSKILVYYKKEDLTNIGIGLDETLQSTSITLVFLILVLAFISFITFKIIF